MRTIFLAAATLLTSIAAHAEDTLQLDLNDDAARIAYAHPLTQRNIRLGGSWLHHQELGNAIGVGMHLMGNAGTGNNPIKAGLGGRLIWLDADKVDADGGVLSLGGYFHYSLPRYDRFAIGGQLYFAPDVIAFGDAEQYLEFSVYGAYNVLRQADVYLGLRNVKADFKQAADYHFDTGFHIGVRLEF